MTQTRLGQARRDENARGEHWFATFTFLDAGCAISASQFRRLVALVTKLWRRVSP